MDGWSRRHAGQSSWGFAMRTLISLVCLVLVGLGTAAVPASAATSSGSSCFDITVGPDSNPIVVTVCPPVTT